MRCFYFFSELNLTNTLPVAGGNETGGDLYVLWFLCFVASFPVGALAIVVLCVVCLCGESRKIDFFLVAADRVTVSRTHIFLQRSVSDRTLATLSSSQVEF